MEKKIIVDEEITLQAASEAVAEEKLAGILASRNQISPWLPWAHHYDENGLEALKKYQNEKLLEFEAAICYSYDIFYKGKFAGNIEVMKISESDHRCEIGYWLVSNMTGKGIMTRAVKKIIQIVQDELKIHRVEIMAAEDNTASRAVIERVGGQLEGISKDYLYLEGKYHNLAIYGIITNA